MPLQSIFIRPAAAFPLDPIDPASLPSASLNHLVREASLPFVKNEGQLDQSVLYYTDVFAGTVYVTNDGLTYALKTTAGQVKTADSFAGVAIKESFVNARPLQPFGNLPNQAQVNYYVGQRSDWKSGIPTFNEVAMGEPWDGITVDLKSVNSNVEKVFTVAPGAYVRDIKIGVEGVTAISKDGEGQLILQTVIGQVAMTRPVAYQEIAGVTRPVEVAYEVGQNNQYSFSIGDNYDPNFELVIDPLIASTYFGDVGTDGFSPVTGGQLDPSFDVAADSGGSVYIAGLTVSNSYPTTTGGIGSTADVLSDVVVTKFSADLSTLLASTYLAGDSLDEATAITIDNSNNIFITGRTNSSDYPTTTNAFQESFNTGGSPAPYDAFISKLDFTDLTLDASTYVGGSAEDEAFDIATNSAGIVYITGRTVSGDFPVILGTSYQQNKAGNPGNYNAFVAALVNDLTDLDGSTYLGGANNDSGNYAIAINGTDHVYVAGWTLATNFPIVGGYDTSKSSANQHDTIIAVFDSGLTDLESSTYHGGGTIAGEHTTPFALAIGFGKVYVAGQTSSSTFPTTSGAYDEDYNGGRDGYVSVLSNSLDTLIDSTVIGGTANDVITGMVLYSNTVFVTVSGGGATYPTTAGAYSTANNDAFISRLDSDLINLIASTSFGGSNTDVLGGIDVSGGNIVVAGYTRSTDFPTTSGALDTTKAGPGAEFDFVVSKLTPNLAANPAANLYHLTINNANTDCEDIGGVWSAPICTLASTLTINSGESLTIDSGVTLTLTASGTINNSGNIINAGSIIGASTISSPLSGITNTGAINVYVQIPDTTISATYATNFPIQVASGKTLTITNSGVLTVNPQPNAPNGGTALRVDGTVSNSGTINNAGIVTGTSVIDSDLIGVTNTGTISIYVRISDITILSDYQTSFPILIASGRTLTVGTGVTLTVNPQPSAPNGGAAIRVDGALNNMGSIDNKGLLVGTNPIDSPLLAISNTGTIAIYVRIPTTAIASDYSSTFPILVPAGTTLTVNSGKTLTLTAQPSAPNGGASLRLDGTLSNLGSLINTGLIVGTSPIDSPILAISNTGTIAIYVRVPNTILNSDYSTTFPIWVVSGRTITINPGVTLTVTPQPSGPDGGTRLRIDGTVNNRGILSNSGLIVGGGTINKDCGSVLNNTGTINPTVAVNNVCPSAPTITSPANGVTIGDNTPTITGTAQANMLIKVLNNGAAVAGTRSDGSGAWTAETQPITVTLSRSPAQSAAEFGFRTAAGDLNNDGYLDLIVGVPFADNGATDNGEVRVFFGSAGPFDPTADAVLTKTPAESTARFGIAVSSGDVNNDGFDDVIVGADFADNGGTDTGEVRIFFGGSSFDTTADAVLARSPAQTNSGFGRTIVSGDVNGDGFDDVIVGAYAATNGATNNGEVRIFFGSSGSFDTTSDATITKTPAEAGAFFGASVTSTDVNGDGYDDIIAGAYQANNGASDNGEARVFLGGPGSFDLTADAILTKTPAEASANFGYTVASGDLNGDGYGDVVVGAYKADNGAADNGEAQIFFGSSGSFDTTSDATLTKSPAEIDAEFSFSLATGDINGDGFDDVIAGPYTADNGDVDNGEARLFYGGTGAFNTALDWVFTKTPAEFHAFFGASATLADLNSDGFADIVVGAIGADNGAANDGEVRIFMSPSFVPLLDGSHTFVARGVSSLGGESPNSNTVTVTIGASDTTAPTGTIAINGGAATTDNPGVTISLTCDDGTGTGCSNAGLLINDPGSNVNANAGANLQLHVHVRSSSDPTGINIVANRPNTGTSIYVANFTLTSSPPQPNAVGYNPGDTIFVSHVYAQNGVKSASIQFKDATGNVGSLVSDTIDLTATANFVGHWAFDEPSGTSIVDDSGYGHNGALGINPSAPSRVAGNVGSGALHFDGVDDIVSIPSKPTLWVTSGFTASAWVKLDSPIGPDGYTIFSKWTSGIEDDVLLVTSLGDLILVTHPCGTGGGAPTTIADGQWHQVAGVHDGTTNSVYFDGQLIASGNSFCDPLWNANGNLYFGAHIRTDGVPPSYLKGSLDDVQWYQRALSAAEIQAIYEANVPAVPTTLTLDPISDVTAGTGVTVSGILTNSVTGAPISGEQITFTGSGATGVLPPVTTGGVEFVKSTSTNLGLVACSAPSSCENDDASLGPDSNTNNNIVLRLPVGGKIKFPDGTTTAVIYFTSIDKSFSYVVEERDGDLKPAQLVPTVDAPQGIAAQIAQTPEGLKELTITEVDGSATTGFVSIAAVLTGNADGQPSSQRPINFEDLTAGTPASPLVIGGGKFFSTGFAQNAEQDGLVVTAHFAGSAAHIASDSNTRSYDAVPDTTGGQQGEGAQVVQTGGTGSAQTGSVLLPSCTTDTGDADGICNTWETSTGMRIAGGVGSAYRIDTGSSYGTADGATSTGKDIYVEIDGMTGYCPTQADVNAVEAAFTAKGFKLHMFLDECNLTVADPLHVWAEVSGGANPPDSNRNNDFDSIKKDHFGTVAERNLSLSEQSAAGGTLGGGADYIEAKALVFHYALFAKNINTGTNQCTSNGISGQAELGGNDFIVSLGCGFVTRNDSDPTWQATVRGTLMHELGHNLGLNHGGGNNDVENCKPNEISVMSYARQMPWSKLSATTASGAPTEWALTYSREALPTLNENSLTESNVLPITASTWSGVLASGSTSFKIIWGKPTETQPSSPGPEYVKTGSTGTIDWDKGYQTAGPLTSGYSQNVNKLNGMFGCEGTTISTALTSYNEWSFLTSSNLNFRDGLSSIDGSKLTVYPDPTTLSELPSFGFEDVNPSAKLVVDAIGNVAPGAPLTVTGYLEDLVGNRLSGKTISLTGSGASGLPGFVTTNGNGEFTASGTAPATVTSGWEVHVHFAGTDLIGPSDIVTKAFDTIDNGPPSVSSTNPINLATNVPLNSMVTATFSEAMDASTITSAAFTLKIGAGSPIAGTVTYNSADKTATLDPTSDLAYSTTYTASIAASVKDAAGNPMGTAYSWSFTTPPSIDNVPPSVSSTNPADLATNIQVGTVVTAKFSEPMDASTITGAKFTLKAGSASVSGTVTYNPADNTATFDPSSDLAYLTTYTATISATVKDVAGNAMGTAYSWSFTTEPLKIKGFYAPVDMDGIVNTIKAGKSVPLKFEVFDNHNIEQTSTSIVKSFTQKKVNCSTYAGDPTDPIEITNTGGTSLRYDAAEGLFIQNWKTPSEGGSCYSVTLTTIDNTSITALFKLLK